MAISANLARDTDHNSSWFATIPSTPPSPHTLEGNRTSRYYCTNSIFLPRVLKRLGCGWMLSLSVRAFFLSLACSLSICWIIIYWIHWYHQISNLASLTIPIVPWGDPQMNPFNPSGTCPALRVLAEKDCKIRDCQTVWHEDDMPFEREQGEGGCICMMYDVWWLYTHTNTRDLTLPNSCEQGQGLWVVMGVRRIRRVEAVQSRSEDGSRGGTFGRP